MNKDANEIGNIIENLEDPLEDRELIIQGGVIETVQYLMNKNMQLGIETVAKKWTRNISILMKNPQFLPNQADILAILSSHELIIFTEFHNN